MAKLYIGNTAYKVMLGNNSAHFMRGVYQNTTNNTFISRQTGGGNLTIDATNGKVLKVEGNSVAWNQQAPALSATMTGYRALNGTPTVVNFSDGVVKYTASHHYGWARLCSFTHKLYLKYDCKADDTIESRSGFSNTRNSAVYVDMKVDKLTTDWKTIARVCTGGTSDCTALVFATKSTNVQSNLYIRNITILDLTLLNYPNIATTTPTVEQVEEWLANNVEIKDYYPYGEGSILNVKMLGIKTTLPNVWTETKDFGVTRVWGKLNGEGSYVQIYPDGMRGVNDVKDVLYLNEDRAECKVGSVDLGSLSWSAPIIVVNYPVSNTTINNVKKGTRGFISTEYAEGSFGKDKTIHGHATATAVYISDSAINGMTSSEVKAYLTGEPLIYELATPLSYTNLMYDQSQANDGSDLIPLSVLTYRVDANGTEEIIRPTSVNGEPTSLAPTMDIKYINANIK